MHNEWTCSLTSLVTRDSLVWFVCMENIQALKQTSPLTGLQWDVELQSSGVMLYCRGGAHDSTLSLAHGLDLVSSPGTRLDLGAIPDLFHLPQTSGNETN